MPYTRRYKRRYVNHASAVNFATCLFCDFNISSERTRAWSRFLFSYEFAVLNLFYHLMYRWFLRTWHTWKVSSNFHTTPLIRSLLRHAHESKNVRYILLHAFVTDNRINYIVWISRYLIQCTVHVAIGLAMCVSYSGLGHGALDYSEVRLYSHLSKHPAIDKSNIVPNLYVLHSSQTICCR